MTRGQLRVAVVAAVVIGAVPQTAAAGTNIGATCEAPSYQTTTIMQFSVDSSAPSYTVPAGGGILTRWAISREAGAIPNPTKLKLFRLTAAPTSFIVVADEQQTVSAGYNEFAARIPVSGGEVLGLYGATQTPYCAGVGSTLNRAVTLTPLGDLTLNSAATANMPGGPQTVLDVAAYIEPDADGDGFGDESQDACPINSSTQGSCPAADPSGPTIDTSGPTIDTKAFKLSKLRKKSRIEMTIGSNEAATVSIDGRLSVPGGASKTYKLKPVSGQVAAGGRIKLKLKVPRKGLRALRRKGRATAIVNVSVRDAAGNQSTGKFTSKLKKVKTKRLIRR